MCALRADSRVSFELVSSEISFADHEQRSVVHEEKIRRRTTVEPGGEMCLA